MRHERDGDDQNYRGRVRQGLRYLHFGQRGLADEFPQGISARSGRAALLRHASRDQAQNYASQGASQTAHR